MDSLLYTLSEAAHKQSYAVAIYHISLPKEVDVLKKATALAVGQTAGTWTPIPGVTKEIHEKYIGKVVNVLDVPSLDLATQITGDQREYLIQTAYPAVNFGTDLPLLITALLNNDASTSAQVKLLDIEFPEEFVRKFRGPRYGIEGIQRFAGISSRPILLNMIKPCTGLTPREGARIFYETALGGVNFIKDDELSGNPVYSKPEKWVKAYRKAAEAAYEKTGERVKYFVNITSGAGEIIGNVKRAEGAGADGLAIDFAVMGYGVLKHVAEHMVLPILGHSAGTGMCFEGAMNGMASPLAMGKPVRLAGADIVMINTPHGGYPLLYQKYMQTVAQLTLPFHDVKPSMPSIGGGVHPGMVEKYIRGVGEDVVLAAGGAVQGHPDGAAAGAWVMYQAIEIVTSGQSLEKAAAEKDELRIALTQWNYIKSRLDTVYFILKCYTMSE